MKDGCEMRKFLLSIYKKDSRTKLKKRLLGTYSFLRKDDLAMEREVKELNMLYKKSDGYILETEEEK